MGIGRVERCEDSSSSWGIEACVVGVVDLYRVVCAVIEQGGIPSHWYMSVICFQQISRADYYLDNRCLGILLVRRTVCKTD